MKRYRYLVAVGILVMAISVLGCTGKNSKVASPALKLAKKMYSMLIEEMPKAEQHEATVAGEIKLSKAKSKQGLLSCGESEESGEVVKGIDFNDHWDNKGNLIPRKYTFEKKKVCYIKYARGEEWGILTTYDCEDKEAGKKKLKRWKERLKEAKERKASDPEPEYEFLPRMERKLARAMTKNPDFDVNACIEDAASVFTDLRIAYLKNRCQKAPTGDEFLKKMLKLARVAKYVDDEFKVDKEEIAKAAAKLKKEGDDDPASDARKALKKYIKWIKGLKDGDAKKALALAQGGDRTCMDWWYFDDSSTQKVSGYKKGTRLCMKVGSGRSSRKSRGSKYDRHKKKYGRDSKRYSPKPSERPRRAYKPTPPPAPVAPAAPPSSSGSASSTGIPECDDYLNKWEACVRTGYPASVRPTLLKSITKMRDMYRKYSSSASMRKAMGTACTRSKQSMAKTTKRYNCKW